eukprot:scaffold203928_cov29-Tisochrysis_lutea.AAC.1
MLLFCLGSRGGFLSFGNGRRDLPPSLRYLIEGGRESQGGRMLGTTERNTGWREGRRATG